MATVLPRISVTKEDKTSAALRNVSSSNVQLNIAVPNALISDAMVRGGYSQTRQKQEWDAHKEKVRQFLATLKPGEVKNIEFVQPIVGGFFSEISNSLTDTVVKAINSCLKKTFGPEINASEHKFGNIDHTAFANFDKAVNGNFTVLVTVPNDRGLKKLERDINNAVYKALGFQGRVVRGSSIQFGRG